MKAFFVGHELCQFKFHGKFMSLRKTMKLKISMHFRDHGFMGFQQIMF